jgi:predicted transcriptional regulator
MRKLYWNEGFSQNALAKVFGVSQANVSQIVRGKRYPDVEMPDNSSRPDRTIAVNDPEVEKLNHVSEEIERRKSKHNQDNLEPEDVVCIRWEYWMTVPSGEKTGEMIANQYEMSKSHISAVARGEKWPYVDGPTSRAEADKANPPSELDLNLNGHA